MPSKYEAFITQKQQLEDLIFSRDTSKNPLEIMKERGFKLGIFDLEIDKLKEIKKGEPGWRPSFNPVTGKSLTPGTSKIHRARLLQFASLRGEIGGPFESTNIFINPSSYENFGPHQLWEQHSKTGLSDIIFGKKAMPAGAKMLSLNAARSQIENVFRSGANDTIWIGHNIVNADINWLKQIGAYPHGFTHQDTYGLLQKVLPGQGYPGGLKQETLATKLLDMAPDSLELHMADADADALRRIFEKTMGPEMWETYSQTTQQRVLSTLFSGMMAAKAGITTAGESMTASYLFDSNDLSKLRELKWSRAQSLFATSDGPVLRKFAHTGTQAGRDYIFRKASAVGKGTEHQLRRMFMAANKLSKNRIHLGLEAIDGVEHLSMFIMDPKTGLPTGERQFLPWHTLEQTGTRGSLTHRGSKAATVGGFLSKGKSGLKEQTFGELFYSLVAKRFGKFNKDRGLYVSASTSNITDDVLKIAVRSAERARILPKGTVEDVGSSMRELGMSSPGDSLRQGALGTALQPVHQGAGVKAGLPYHLANERQFLADSPKYKIQGALPEELAKIQGEYRYLNVTRPGEIARGKAKRTLGSVFTAIKEHSQSLLDTIKVYGLSAISIKPELMMRGIFTRGSGMHYGFTAAGMAKGTHQLRDIAYITSSHAVRRITANYGTPAIIPSGSAEILSGLSKIHGRNAAIGASARLAIVSGGGAREAFRTFGDPGLLYGKGALEFLKRPGTPRNILAQELSSDLLDRLGARKRLKLSLLGNLDFGPDSMSLGLAQGDVLGSTGDKAHFMRKGHRLSRIKYDQSAGGFRLTMVPESDAISSTTSMLVGPMRTTAHGFVPGLSSTDFIGHSQFFSKKQATYFHLGEQIRKRGLTNSFTKFLGSIGHAVTVGPGGAIESPNMDITTFSRHAAKFLTDKGVRPSEWRPQKFSEGGMTGLKFEGQSMMHRLSSDEDIGHKRGGALRIRLDRIREAQMMEDMVGYSRGGPLSNILKRIHRHTTHDSLSEFKLGMGILSGKVDRAGALSRATELGLEVYTPQELREMQRLTGGPASGKVTRGQYPLSYLEKHLNKGFLIDFGDESVQLPMGYGSFRGRGQEALATTGRNVMYIPSARQTGFAFSRGTGHVGSVTGRISSFINTIAQGARGKVVSQSAFMAYKGWEEMLFGKGKRLDKISMMTPRLQPSMAGRAAPHTQRYLSNAERIFTVEVSHNELRQHAKEFGLSKGYLKRLMAGDAYAYMHVDPQQRPMHSVLVKVRAVSEKELINKEVGGKLGPFSERFIRAAAELLGVAERDVDQDRLNLLFLDTESKLFKKMGISKAEAKSMQKELGGLWKAHAERFAPELQKQHESLLRFEDSLLKKSIPASQIITGMTGSHLSDLLSMKGAAAGPWVHTRMDRYMVNRMWQIAKKARGDKDLAMKLLSRMMERQFGFTVTADNPLIANILKNVANQLPSSEIATETMNVQQRYMQFALEKAGQIKEASHMSLEMSTAAQHRVFQALNSGITDPEELKKIAMQGIEEDAGGLIYGTKFMDAGIKGKVKVSDRAAGAFTEAVGSMHLLRGAYAHVQQSDTSLGKSSSEVSLLVGKSNIRTKNFAGAVMAFGEANASDMAAATVPLHTILDETDANEPFVEAVKERLHKKVTREINEATKSKAAGAADGAISMVDEFSKDMKSLWSNKGVRYAAYGIGGLGAAAMLLNAIPGTRSDYLTAPPITSSRAFNAGTPLAPSPMVNQDRMRFPSPPSYRQRIRMGRNEPAIQLNGTVRGGNPYSSMQALQDTIQSGGIQSGHVRISDDRRPDGVGAAFEARDMLDRDYILR